MTTTDGYGWNDIRKAVGYWGLHEEGPVCTVATEWAEMLKAYGPTWIVEIGNPYHAVVVTGIEGDGTPEGSFVTVNNPWPPNQGKVERETYAGFASEFELGAGADAAIVQRLTAPASALSLTNENFRRPFLAP